MADTLSRRNFMKLGAAAIAGGVAAGPVPNAKAMGTFPTATGPTTLVKGYCPFCQVRCTYQAQVQNGKVVSVIGEAGNRWTAGAMCPKGMSMVELVQSPHRITQPMLRTENGWKNISYDEAVTMVAEKLMASRKANGDKISGRLALTSPLWDCRESELAALMMMRLAGGVNVMPPGEVCISSAANVLSMFLGANTSTTTVNEILNAKTLVLWGANINELYPPYTRWLDMAKEKGVNMVYVDCRKTRTSLWCNSQLMPRPGTDGALVFGAIRHIIETNAYDPAFAEANLAGLPELQGFVASYTVAKVAENTGLSEAEINAFYKTIAESPSTILWLGGSMSRYTNGVQTIRAMLSLQALTNNLMGPGKGVLTMEGGKPEGEKEFIDMVCGEAKAEGVNFRRLLAAMKKGDMDVLFLNSSYRRYPDSKGVLEALKKVNFIVHRGFFMTEDTEVAHLFVPATFSLESQGSHYGAEKHVVWRDKAVEAPGACVPDWQFYRDIGMKIAPETYPNFKDPAELNEMFRTKLESWTGITVERLRQSEGGLVWPLPEADSEERLGTVFTENKILTPDGKFTFTSNLLGPLKWDYPKGSPHGPEADAAFPLVLTQGKVLTHWQQTLTNFAESLAQFSNGRYVNIHPETAKEQGLAEGDKVMLETPVGGVEARVEITDLILPGIIFTPSHLSKSSPFPQNQSEHINTIIPNYWDRISAQFNGSCCRLRKI